MFAVIQTGGKQYVVREGDVLKVEKIAGAPKSTVLCKDVLLVGSEDGAIRIGTPYLSDASVSATILEQGKNKKVSVIKYHSKTRYRRRTGHRQLFTRLHIKEIKG